MTMLKPDQFDRSMDRSEPLPKDAFQPGSMRNDRRSVELRTGRRDLPSITPGNLPRRSDAITSAAARWSRSTRKQRVRWGLFALLPIVLLAGSYWYVTGGEKMSTDDAYVEADKVSVSTDVSGIV
jgi:hypothetical protein